MKKKTYFVHWPLNIYQNDCAKAHYWRKFGGLVVDIWSQFGGTDPLWLMRGGHPVSVVWD